MQKKCLIASLIILVVILVTIALIVFFNDDVQILDDDIPTMDIIGFDLYNPPDRLVHSWFDYTDGKGGPSPDNKPTDTPTFMAKYPYRAVFFGGFEDRTHTQGYDSGVFIVFSTKPVLDNFTFEYKSTRGPYGNIRATLNDWADDDVFIVGDNTWAGVSSGQVNVYHWATTRHVTYKDPYFFTFDFYYQDCGTLQMTGLRNIADVPYAYILTCTDSNGLGGGSQSGSSSSGSSSSGSSGGSSGGGNSVPSGIPGGPGTFPEPESSWSDWEQSGGGRSNPETYPWEDDNSIPEKDWNPTIPNHSPGSEADTGEKGDTWELPEYTIPGLPFTTDDLNIPPMPELNFPAIPGMPDATPPSLDYYPDEAGAWPPPFPGTN